MIRQDGDVATLSLPTIEGQLSKVTSSSLFGLAEILDNVKKRPSGTDRWELPRVANQNQTINILEIQGSEDHRQQGHIDHRTLIDDYGSGTTLFIPSFPQ